MNMPEVEVMKTGQYDKLNKALYLWFTTNRATIIFCPDNLGYTDTQENASGQHSLDNRATCRTVVISKCLLCASNLNPSFVDTAKSAKGSGLNLNLNFS